MARGVGDWVDDSSGVKYAVSHMISMGRKGSEGASNLSFFQASSQSLQSILCNLKMAKQKVSTFLITLTDFWMLNKSCISDINPSWLWYVILFVHYWIHFDNILLRIIACTFIRSIYLQFSFPTMSVSGFGIRLMLVS